MCSVIQTGPTKVRVRVRVRVWVWILVGVRIRVRARVRVRARWVHIMKLIHSLCKVNMCSRYIST